MIDAPEGMAQAAFNAHPVRKVIRDAAYQGKRVSPPSRRELDALELPGSARKKLAAAIEEVREINSTGAQSDSWARGDELAAEIVATLPNELRDPDYLDPPPEPDTDNPRELAARVSPRL